MTTLPLSPTIKNSKPRTGRGSESNGRDGVAWHPHPQPLAIAGFSHLTRQSATAGIMDCFPRPDNVCRPRRMQGAAATYAHYMCMVLTRIMHIMVTHDPLSLPRRVTCCLSPRFCVPCPLRSPCRRRFAGVRTAREREKTLVPAVAQRHLPQAVSNRGRIRTHPAVQPGGRGAKRHALRRSGRAGGAVHAGHDGVPAAAPRSPACGDRRFGRGVACEILPSTPAGDPHYGH